MSIHIVQPDGEPHELELGSALPEALPVLPLKDSVPFPDTLTPLAVGQDRSVRLVNDAYAPWLGIALERPGDADLLRKVEACRRPLFWSCASSTIRQHLLHPLEAETEALAAQVNGRPEDSALRHRLACAYELLGELYFWEQSADRCRACRLRAHELLEQ